MSCGCDEFLPCMHVRRRVPKFDKVSKFSATRCHATTLILALMRSYSSSRNGKTILDAFGGSGSDAVHCEDV